jgi:hypothetical protein
MIDPRYLAVFAGAAVFFIALALAKSIITGRDKSNDWVFLVFVSIFACLLALICNESSVTTAQKLVATTVFLVEFILIVGFSSLMIAITKRREMEEICFGFCTMMFGIFIIIILSNNKMFLETAELSTLKFAGLNTLAAAISGVLSILFGYCLFLKRKFRL